MLVPLNWLREYVELPKNLGELVERLTLAGLESPGVRVVGLPVPDGLRVKPDDAGLVWERDQVVLAKVLRIEKHPDADKLKLVTVDYGAAEPKTVVTGAPNIAPGQSGMKVVLGLRGTRYYYQDKDGKKGIFTLEPKALRGIMNDAMCMSNYELGIAEDHDGIIILDDADPAPGTPMQDVLGDVIVELDVLPNMARCLALLGIAREVAALTGATVKEPKPTYPTSGAATGKATVQIDDAKLCPRYSATIIENITVGTSPRWMRSRLQSAGMRGITNAVDITNYVMLEYGQPLHAFDYDVLVKRAGGKAPTVIVRRATAGEKLVTLDGVERTLSPDNLVIADTAGAIALAGVMGGRDTEVSSETKTILLESAAFDAVIVRKTARQFNLFSEASTRFSKGIHPEVVPLAAARAAELFHQHAGGNVLAGVIEQYPAPLPVQKVELNRNEIERILGVSVPDGEVERVLLALKFKLDATPWGWTVTVPENRLDIQAGSADIIEELARVSGYDRLPGRLLALEMPTPTGNRELELEHKTLDILVVGGLNECITYSLSSFDAEAKLHPVPKVDHNAVILINPLSPERGMMRRTLLPGLLEVAARNLQNAERVAFFELGCVFLPDGNNLPKEPKRVAIVLSGRRGVPAWDEQVKAAQYDVFDLKGVIEQLLAGMNIPAATYTPATEVPQFHPGRSATVTVNGVSLGTLGELHPKVAKAFDLTDRTVLVAELDLDALFAAIPTRKAYAPFSTLPAAKRDVAVIVDESMSSERVLAELKAAGGDLLMEATLFDVYRGESIPAGTKSLAYALTYQPKEKTLTDKEIDKAHLKIESRLKHVLKAGIRGKE
jgi:phenylalanyl-tRNA synthetase beta chain